jgi:hypothetical protein
MTLRAISASPSPEAARSRAARSEEAVARAENEKLGAFAAAADSAAELQAHIGRLRVVWTGRCCLPRHQHTSEPSFLELNGIL